MLALVGIDSATNALLMWAMFSIAAGCLSFVVLMLARIVFTHTYSAPFRQMHLTFFRYSLASLVAAMVLLVCWEEIQALRREPVGWDSRRTIGRPAAPRRVIPYRIEETPTEYVTPRFERLRE